MSTLCAFGHRQKNSVAPTNTISTSAHGSCHPAACWMDKPTIKQMVGHKSGASIGFKRCMPASMV